MKYFNPANLVQHEATFNYTAKSGVGFGILPNDEQVFISARMVVENNLNVGDLLRVWAVDNFASPETAHYASRWRAVRMEVIHRIDDIVRSTPNASPATAAPTPATVDFVGMVDKMLTESRPWTINEMTHAIAKSSTAMSAQPDLLQRVGTRLAALHRLGEAACLKVYSKADNDRANAVYYAKSVDVFYEHLDTPLNDEEDE